TVYGATRDGMTMWWIGSYGDDFNPSQPVSVIKNMTIWNIDGWGGFPYSKNNVTYEGVRLVGDPDPTNKPDLGTTGITGVDYMSRNVLITNANIQNAGIGIGAATNVGRLGLSSGSQQCSPSLTPDIDAFTIQNSYLNNQTNVYVKLLNTTNGGD